MDITPGSTRKARVQAARIAVLERKLKKSEKKVADLSAKLYRAESEAASLRQSKNQLWKEKTDLFMSVNELGYWRPLIVPPAANNERWGIALQIDGSTLHSLRSNPYALFSMISNHLTMKLLEKWKEVTHR